MVPLPSGLQIDERLIFTSLQEAIKWSHEGFNYSDQFKKIVKRYVRFGYHATVCMPGFKPNHSL